MSYRVASSGWSGGGALVSTTPVVILEPGVLAALSAAYPGWTSASASGSSFTFTAAALPTAQLPSHRVVASVSTPGGLGTAAFTYTVDGGAAQGPITTSRTFPNGAANPAFFAFPVPGTTLTVIFTDTTFPSGASIAVVANGVIATLAASSGMPSTNAAYGSISPQAATSPFTYSTPMTLTLDTLAACIAGAQVLINTGTVWQLGTVISDGTTQQAGGLSLPASARAAITLGYLAPSTSIDLTTYSIAGRSGDGTHIFYSAGGVLAFAATSLTTLGSLAPGSVAVIETAPTNPQSDGGAWRVLSV